MRQAEWPLFVFLSVGFLCILAVPEAQTQAKPEENSQLLHAAAEDSAAMTAEDAGAVPQVESNQTASAPAIEFTVGVASAAKDAHRRAEFTRLKVLAQNQATVPVIVEVAVPDVVTLMSRSAAAQTRESQLAADANLSRSISAVAQGELARLANVPHTPRRTFDTVPFFSLNASAQGLQVLEDSANVIDINEVIRYAPTLDDTVDIVEASNAWASGFDGSGWYVAVLDTGIWASHNFFAGKDIVESCFASGADDDPNNGGDCPNGLAIDTTSTHAAMPFGTHFSGFDHGSHVAGIAAGNDSTRVPPLYGVARGADIIAIQVFSKFEFSDDCNPAPSNCVFTSDDDLLAALQHVFSLRLSYPIAAVNMSIGGGKYTSQATCDANKAALKAQIDLLRGANIATVIASGNNGFCDALSAPGCISSAVAVGATDDFDNEVDFSNRSTLLDIFAPGYGIQSAEGFSDNSYGEKNGTSMAAPHVAGAWAIFKQAVPGLTVAETLNTLNNTGVAVARKVSSTSGTCPSVYPQRRIRINTAIDALAGGVTPCSVHQQTPAASAAVTFPLSFQWAVSPTCAPSYVAWATSSTPNSYVFSSVHVPSPFVISQAYWDLVVNLFGTSAPIYYWAILQDGPSGRFAVTPWRPFSIAGICDIQGTPLVDCEIDAGQPHRITNPVPAHGSNQLALSFTPGYPVAGLTASDFIVSVHPGPAPAGFGISQVSVNGSTVTLQFNHMLPTRHWTCVMQPGCSSQMVCNGVLPGDSNANQVSDANDVNGIILSLTTQQGLWPVWATDIDRSGVTDASDLIQSINVLNGAGAFDPWLGATLPGCP